MEPRRDSGNISDWLLIGGVLSSLLYVGTDVLAGILYPGYSFADQAVSELFALGAPTSRLVVRSFTVSSVLLAAFALGVWRSSGANRRMRIVAFMFLGNAIDSLLLWNFFPMHMRGEQPTFTDTMHGILAINPFVLLSIAFGAAAFGNRFRFYSIVTIVILVVPACFAFLYAPRVFGNLPTPGLGLTERVSQYGHQLWQAVLAAVLLSQRSSHETTDHLLSHPGTHRPERREPAGTPLCTAAGRPLRR